MLLGIAALVLVLGAVVVGLMIWGASEFGDRLFPGGDLDNGTAGEASAKGYTVPPGATHVYLKDRAAMDVRTSWFRFELPDPMAYTRVMAEILVQPGVKHTTTAVPPSNWPDFRPFEDFDAPPWWDPPPGAQVFLVERPFDTSTKKAGSSHTTGVMIVLDEPRRRVYQWRWSWQWWNFK